jgi:multidrug efflux pump subunit AcrB
VRTGVAKRSADQVAGIVLRTTDAGTQLTIGDVARVRVEGVDRDRAYFVGPDPAISVRVDRSASGDAIRMQRTVEEVAAEMESTLPQGVEISLIRTLAEGITARLNILLDNGLMGLGLVVVLLFLFLNARTAFWVAMGIPVAMTAAIAMMYVAGFTINMISLFALIITLGIVVDDAIVVGENIHREVESGRREGLEAAVVGTQLVFKPVVFGVITTIIAFAPWAMLTGPTRAFTQQITFVVIASLVFSIIECMFILPAHLAHMKKEDKSKQGALARFQQRIADSLLWFAQFVYKPVLEFALRMRYATIVFFFIVFSFAIMLVANRIVPFKFMPEIESDLVQVTIDMPEGTPFSRTLEVRDQLQNGINGAEN